MMAEKRSVTPLSEIISGLCGNSRKLSITIIGAFGARNVGDLAIMKTIVNDLAANNWITCSFASRDEVLKNTYRVRTMNPFGISGIRKLLRDNVIVIGGGGLYGHETHRYLVWMLPFLYILKNIFGKKIIFYNVGIYRAEDKKVLKMLWPVLASADRVILRDDSDLEILPANIAARAEVEPDITFRLQPEIPKDPGAINLLQTPDDYVVGLSLRYTNLKDPGNANDSRIAESVKQVIVKKYLEAGARVAFIPFQPEDLQYVDTYFNDVQKKYPEKFIVVNTNEMKVEEVKWVVSRLSIAIGMRLHFQIFANDLDIPLIGISYAPKCTNFLKKAKCTAIDAYKIDSDKLDHAIKEMATSLGPVTKHATEIQKESSL